MVLPPHMHLETGKNQENSQEGQVGSQLRFEPSSFHIKLYIDPAGQSCTFTGRQPKTQKV
jgi:hypothetical protein